MIGRWLKLMEIHDAIISIVFFLPNSFKLKYKFKPYELTDTTLPFILA